MQMSMCKCSSLSGTLPGICKLFSLIVQLACSWARKVSSDVASSISEGDIFLYLCSAQLTSFKIDLISKEINCEEQGYMNVSNSLIELVTPLNVSTICGTWAKEIITISRPQDTPNHLSHGLRTENCYVHKKPVKVNCT